MSRYLTAAIKRHDNLRAEIEQIQQRAKTENRDLSDDELRSVTRLANEAGELVPAIAEMGRQETRNREVGETAATIDAAIGDQNRGERLSGGAYARDRDPGHYRSEVDGGKHSFFGDIVRSKQGYGDAERRLAEHNRALATGTEGPGLVPPNWLAEMYETIARQGRRAAAAAVQVPLGNDPRPLTLPRQSAGTDAVVAAQAVENDAPASTDAYDSAVTIVTPVPISGVQIISRQMLDMATPAIDQLLYGDMLAALDQDVESRVVAAMIASAGAAVTTYATEAAWTAALDPAAATYIGDELIDTALAVRNARKLPANVVVASVNRYGSLLKIKDASGRPLMPAESGGPMNVVGVGEVAVDGRINGLGIVASDGITQYPESILVARMSDVINFESQAMRFRYEEPSGPQSIKIGVWGYQATHIMHSGDSVKRIVVTAAA